ncbi:MAG TPA: ABC transporter permease [Gemmata sp.]|nr:ABC transporter permease [Gemmata sp.]
MTTRELTRFALGGLWRQKVRTALTLVGVTVGTCALAFSLALGFGLHAFIEKEFQGRDEFWRVTVLAGEPSAEEKDAPPEKVAVRGAMSDERRSRLREALVERYFATRPRQAAVALTPEKLAAIAALPGVREVRTYRVAPGRLAVESAARPATVDVTAGALTELEPRFLAGGLPAPGAREVVVSELALYDLGLRDDADLAAAVGLPVRLEVGGVRNTQPVALALALTGRVPSENLTAAQQVVLEKLAAALPGKLDLLDLTPAERAEVRRLLEAKADPDDESPSASGAVASDTYRVCGVVRVMTKEHRKKAGPLERWELTQGDAFLPPGAGDELLSRLPWSRGGEVYSADVRVHPGGNLQATVDAIEAMGYRTFSGAKWFAAAKREVTLIAAGLNLFAMIALFVAGIGITNTLVTSVVERTKEIGILRAVGATRAQVQGMFLAEGAFIGLLGSVLGLALARGLSIPADTWVHGILKKQIEEDRILSTTVFSFPWWLWVGSVAFAVLVTTAAAYYPARRAAKIHPIEALRYG